MIRSTAILALCATAAVGSVAGAAEEATPLPRVFPVACSIKPLKDIAINSVLPGIVEEVFVEPGQRVAAGDPLVRLDTDLAKADLLVAEQRASFQAALDAAMKRELAMSVRVIRLERALQRNAISQVEYEDMVMQLDLAKAEVAQQRQALALARAEADRARLRVDKALIRSPADGIVGEDLIDPSEATNDRPVVRLFVTERLRIEAFVPIARLSEFRAAETFRITVNDDDARFEAAFDYVSPVADLSSNTISVFFHLDGTDVLPGSKCVLSWD